MSRGANRVYSVWAFSLVLSTPFALLVGSLVHESEPFKFFLLLEATHRAHCTLCNFRCSTITNLLLPKSNVLFVLSASQSVTIAAMITLISHSTSHFHQSTPLHLTPPPFCAVLFRRFGCWQCYPPFQTDDFLTREHDLAKDEISPHWNAIPLAGSLSLSLSLSLSCFFCAQKRRRQ